MVDAAESDGQPSWGTGSIPKSGGEDKQISLVRVLVTILGAIYKAYVLDCNTLLRQSRLSLIMSYNMCLLILFRQSSIQHHRYFTDSLNR